MSDAIPEEIKALRARIAQLEQLASPERRPMYNDPAKTREERKEQGRAEQWQHDPRMERAAQLKAGQPAEYNKLPPSVKIALAHYLAGKAAAERAGKDVTR